MLAWFRRWRERRKAREERILKNLQLAMEDGYKKTGVWRNPIWDTEAQSLRNLFRPEPRNLRNPADTPNAQSLSNMIGLRVWGSAASGIGEKKYRKGGRMKDYPTKSEIRKTKEFVRKTKPAILKYLENLFDASSRISPFSKKAWVGKDKYFPKGHFRFSGSVRALNKERTAHLDIDISIYPHQNGRWDSGAAPGQRPGDGRRSGDARLFRHLDRAWRRFRRPRNGR